MTIDKNIGKKMPNLITILILTTLLAVDVLAQETKIALPTYDNTSSFTVIGTDADRKMRFFADGGFYLSGENKYGTIPATGAGSRLMWYPKRSALRAGYVDGTQWDDASTGNYSIGFGYCTTAESYISTAIGRFNVGGGNRWSWVATDPLFEIGKGSGAESKSNALTVLKNGKVGIGPSNPSSKLEVSGTIYSTSGGFKFPDGTTQASAAETETTYWTASGSKIFNSNNGNVGINEIHPTAELHIGGTNGFLVEGTLLEGTMPAYGEGARMMFYPKKVAFRVGYVDGTHWDDINTGQFSTAMGRNTTASEYTSTAMGWKTTASGLTSTAMGNGTTASGVHSTAMGSSTTASGYKSTAMGVSTTASGDRSTAMGNYCTTDNREGSFVIGDYSTTTIMEARYDNIIKMRFAGGYTFYTNSGTSSGVYLSPGGSSWHIVSDSTKKDNYLDVDGEYFLNSIAKLKLGSWNYKSQNPKEYRHYGPMAQEIFHYFGKDAIGPIGNDTSLATGDMDGIMMISIKALEKRTQELGIINEKLEKHTAEKEILELRIQKLEEEKAVINARNEKLENKNNSMEERLAILEEMMLEFVNTNKIEVVKK